MINKMHLILLFISVLVFQYGHAQTWNTIGSTAGMTASEVDIEIAPDGSLYMAYVNTSVSNKVSVKKWMNNAWTTVGTTTFGSDNAFDIQLVIQGNNVPAVTYKTIYLSQYPILETYRLNGATWSFLGVGNPMLTNHNFDFSLAPIGTSDLVLTYYNQLQDFPIDVWVAVNLVTGNQIGANLTLHDEQNGDEAAGTAVGTVGTALNAIQVVYSTQGLGIAAKNYNFTNAWNPQGNFNTDIMDKLVLKKPGNNMGLGWIDNNGSGFDYLRFRGYNGSSYGTNSRIDSITASSAFVEFDMDGFNDNYLVFYKKGLTAYVKTITGSMTPTIAALSSGIAVAPVSASTKSFKTELKNNIRVIAYVDGTTISVKEYNVPANIEDFDLFQMCEGTSFNNNGDVALFNLDDNYSQANITMTCVSQNTGVLPQSAITINGNGLAYYLNIATTNSVLANTIVDLQWNLFENGTLVQSTITPVTIFKNPTINFTFPIATVCENVELVNLVGKVSPGGGDWSGQGVIGNKLYPGFFNPTPTTTSYVYYSKTNAQGCTASDSVLITINQAPNLTITTDNADCDLENGSASVAISGGTPSYTTYWSSGSSFTSVTDLPTGQYFVTVTDNNGCSSVGVASIGSNGINLAQTTTNVDCFGGTNGGINLTPSGANAPFTYAWSNGATTQDLANIPAGPYEVSVTDATGCITTASYTVFQPAELVVNSATITTASCAISNGSITISASGGSQPFTYAWENAAGTSIGTNSPTVSALDAGYYICSITDNLGCTFQTAQLISNTNGPVVAIDTVLSSDCSNNGSILLSDVSNNVQNYLWNTGATSQNLSNLAPGLYIVEATGANGCTSVLSTEVLSSLPEAVDICLVTVDTTTNTNLVVWEKPVTNGIDHFNVYRETSQAGNYQLAGTVAYADESLFNDLVASPSVRSWRYKISSVDACGVESNLSDNHKTIHLVISQGLGGAFNLAWDSYEGFPYSEFVIYRHTDLDNWIQLTTMPTNLFTYTDTPPTELGLEYLLTVNAPSLCSTTKAQDFNTTRSNRDKSGFGSEPQSVDEYLDAHIALYPSPSNGTVTIANQTNESLEIQVIDALGRQVSTATITSDIEKMALNTLENGVYQVIFRSATGQTVKQLVIQH